jgi:hypothetical protein
MKNVQNESKGSLTFLITRGIKFNHVRWVPCHHGMARPQVADGGNDLQIWRVAANILKSSSGQPTRGCPPAWGLGVGLTTPHLKNFLVTKIHKKPRTWTDSLDNRPKQRKMDKDGMVWTGSNWLLRIGTSGGLL